MSNLEKNRENSDHLSFWDKLRNLKDSILWKKETVEDIKWETSKKSELLKWNVVDSALDDLRVNVDSSVEFDEVQKKTQDELSKMKIAWKEKFHTHTKAYVVENRDKQVAEWITQASRNLENEIKNWDKEQNPVARSLLNIANKIMGTEK